MGTSGVPWNVPKDLIIEALKKNHGRLMDTAAVLDCHYTTLKKHINKDPELVELINELRNGLHEIMLDDCESVLQLALSKARDDMSNALRATMFYLNNKGKGRGYSPNAHKEQPVESVDEVLSAVQRIDKNPRDPSLSESRVETPPPVLDQGPQRQEDPVPAELGTEHSSFEFPPV